MVLLCLFLQCCVCFTQRRARPKAMLKDMLLTILFLKPARDVYRVVRGHEREAHEVMDGFAELLASKMCEVFSEALPGSVLQTISLFATISEGKPVTHAVVGSIAISVLMSSYALQQISYVSHEHYLTPPNSTTDPSPPPGLRRRPRKPPTRPCDTRLRAENQPLARTCGHGDAGRDHHGDAGRDLRPPVGHRGHLCTALLGCADSSLPPEEASEKGRLRYGLECASRTHARRDHLVRYCLVAPPPP